MELAEALRSLNRNERILILSSLILIAALSWAYLFYLAAVMGDMDAMPGMASMQPVLAQWTPGEALAMFVMWAVMMAAMMLPSALPMILLHAALKARTGGGAVAYTGRFTLGYIVVWCAFSAAATTAQWALEQAALLSPMMVASSALLGGGLLIVAGIYQMTPYKNRCLSHCRSPAHFLADHRHPGGFGAFRTGVEHGLYCLGCCWAVMLLLFVGGVMNLLWIAALAAFVLIEKVIPHGPAFGRASGVVMIVAGAWLILV